MTWSPALRFLLAYQSVTKEPDGLSRSYGKRPDGLSVVPWDAGKPLSWDVTVVCPLADSCVVAAASSPWGWFTSRGVGARKAGKYTKMATSHIFQPLAIESLGPINASGCTFLVKSGSQAFCPVWRWQRPGFRFSESLFWFSVLMLFYSTTVLWRRRSSDHSSFTFFFAHHNFSSLLTEYRDQK